MFSSKFSQLPIHERFKEAINDMGLVEMTPIQYESIPYLLDDKDLMGAAKTGSGKTLAFLVPLVNKIYSSNFDPKCGTQAIIMSPTRELSLQIFNQLKLLICKTELTCGLVIGGNSKEDEEIFLRSGITILVATPGRLLDHLCNTNHFNYENVKILVIDEADRLMSQGFMEEMQAIIKKLPKERQTVLFSATLQMNAAKMKRKMKDVGTIAHYNEKKRKSSLEDKVLKLAFISLKLNCICIDLSCQDLPDIVTGNNHIESMTNNQLKQNYVVCKAEDKYRVLLAFISSQMNMKVMVFMATVQEVTFYYKLFKFLEVKSMYLHGKQTNSKRQSNFNQFKASKAGVLFCTDVASRGLDIPDVDWVLQFDPPNDASEYIHRVGRTARAGKNGKALMILRRHETGFLTILSQKKVILERIDFEMKEDTVFQNKIQKLINKISELYELANNAYISVVTSYKNHKLSCFDEKKLDRSALALTFGLKKAPPMGQDRADGNKPRKNKRARDVNDDITAGPSRPKRNR